MIVSLSVITPGFYNGTEMVGRKKKKKIKLQMAQACAAHKQMQMFY